MPIVLSEINDPERLKRLARQQLARLEVSAAATGEQMVRVSNWLTAALFTINGAGALTAATAVQRPDGSLWPGFLFIAGLAFAMLSGVLIQHFQSLTAAPVEHMLDFWNEVAATGIVHDDYDKLREPITRSERWHWSAPVMGWLSGTLFAVACVVLAATATESRTVVRAECSNLRSDMLRVRPRRSDSRELFEALHCAG